MSYTKAHIAATKRAILAAFPNAVVEDWQDYGWRLTVVAPNRSSAITVLQPMRPPEGDFEGQPQIEGTAEQAIEWLQSLQERK